jgi:hypothetical protein
MPKELLDAHRENDAAVDVRCGSRRFKTNLEHLEFLFDMLPIHRLTNTA